MSCHLLTIASGLHIKSVIYHYILGYDQISSCGLTYLYRTQYEWRFTETSGLLINSSSVDCVGNNAHALKYAHAQIYARFLTLCKVYARGLLNILRLPGTKSPVPRKKKITRSYSDRMPAQRECVSVVVAALVASTDVLFRIC